MSLSQVQLSYFVIQSTSIDPNLDLPWDVELDQYPCLSSLAQIDPLYFSFGDNLATSKHVSKRKNKRSRWRKQIQRGKPLAFGHRVDGKSSASGHHARNKPITFAIHVGGIRPPFGHHVGKNHSTSGHHVETRFFVEIPCQHGGMGLLSKNFTHR